MAFTYEDAERHIEEATEEIFAGDPRVQSVGIGRSPEGGFCFRAVRNMRQVLPMSATLTAVSGVASYPVIYADAFGEVQASMRVPFSALTGSFVAEQQRMRPLVCGLQIQNFDHDARSGHVAQGLVTIGTLGCFVRLASGDLALLSNNHVIGAENVGRTGDRIAQAGGLTLTSGDEVAELDDFVPLQPSPVGVQPRNGIVAFNEVDAGLARLSDGASQAQQFLTMRGLPGLSGTARPKVGDKVFKVGRTTGLTWGTITDIATSVGPVSYSVGSCWFRRSFTIEGVNGTMFSDRGDSGSIIVRTTGEVVGLLYAGNGTQTYACPIQAVLSALRCTLA